MKKLYSLSLFLLLFVSFSFGQAPIGSQLEMAEVVLPNANGTDASLNQEARRNGVIIVFSCNTCPFVVGSKHFPGWENQYN